MTRYLLVDPINVPVSGVTAYTALAVEALRGVIEVTTCVRQPREEIEAFRQRVAETAMTLADDGDLIVETPETRCSSLRLAGSCWSHVRLHCPASIASSYDLGGADPAVASSERQAIGRATVVSSPSSVMAEEIWRLLPVRQQFVYPNPVPVQRRTGAPWSDRPIDVLFLGRLQPLKGMALLGEILRLLPRSLTTAVAGPEAKRFLEKAELSGRVEAVDGADAAAGRDALHSAKIVIVPSLFESFSMVQAEAAAAGAHVVAAAPSGIAEFLGPRTITTIADRVPDRWARCIVEMLGGGGPDPEATARELAAINHRFRQGVSDLVRHVRTGSVAPLQVTRPATTRPIRYLTSPRGGQTTMPTRYAKKMRKLRRDPVAFVRDMKVLRLLGASPPGSSAAGGATASSRSGPPSRSTAGAENQPRLEPREVARLVGEGATLALHSRERGIADPRLSTLFFVRRKHPLLIHENHVRDLVRSDFVGFGERYLHFVSYLPRHEEPGDEMRLIEAIKPQQREHLAAHQNFLFVDPRGVLAYAVRSLSASSRLFVVLTDPEAGDAFEVRPDEIDVLITHADHPDARRTDLRRRSLFHDPAEIIPTLERLLIEASAPPHNMLLPVFNGLDFRPETVARCGERHDGLIVTRDLPREASNVCFGAYLDRFSRHVTDVLLKEEIFMRYRTLCEQVRADPAHLPLLLERSLKDGVRYDVST